MFSIRRGSIIRVNASRWMAKALLRKGMLEFPLKTNPQIPSQILEWGGKGSPTPL